jgi:hypothetical protein
MKILTYTLIIGSLLSCGGESGSGELRDGVGDGDHRIFVTSTSYTGNLGGVSGADAKCTSHASSAGLVREYKAIVSDSTSNASGKLQITGSVYIFSGSTSKDLIVSAGSDLWATDTTSLLSSVDKDENFSTIGLTPWTGTDSDGTVALSSDHCSDWSTASAGTDGQVGSTNSTTDGWLEDPSSISCNNSHPIFCISE